MRVADRTPPQYGNVNHGVMCRDVKVGDRVVSVGGALDGGFIDAVFYH